eukprot:scaffold242681_cov34-Tisochrysis_lutea.AAC.1
MECPECVEEHIKVDGAGEPGDAPTPDYPHVPPRQAAPPPLEVLLPPEERLEGHLGRPRRHTDGRPARLDRRRREAGGRAGGGREERRERDLVICT